MKTKPLTVDLSEKQQQSIQHYVSMLNALQEKTKFVQDSLGVLLGTILECRNVDETAAYALSQDGTQLVLQEPKG